MKRTIVQDGKKTKDSQAPSGAITPTTQKVDNELSEKLQTVEEERRITASDFEKGSRESEDGTVDVKQREGRRIPLTPPQDSTARALVCILRHYPYGHRFLYRLYHHVHTAYQRSILA